MRFETKPENPSQVLRIAGELTIYRAAEWKAAILGNPPPREVDLSGVTEMDTAGLQLLMLAKKTALAAQREMRLVAHSPAVMEVFELLGVATFFGDPVVMESSKPSFARRPHGS